MRSQSLMVSGGSKNYWGNGTDGALSTSGDVTIASTLDGDMIVRNYTSLTVNTGHTLTVSNRCKGLVIYVAGDCTINGKISMTARGAAVDASTAGDPSGVAGLKFPRFTAAGSDTYAADSPTALANAGAAIIAAEANQKRIGGNGTVYTIARYGASPTDINPVNGTDSSGSGGGGGSWNFFGGRGGRGTCFSGGAGGGGGSPAGAGWDGADNGGAGGDGAAGGGYGTGGGTGNPGGAGSGAGSGGASGTGGTLVLLVKGILTIGAAGAIEAKGVSAINNGSGAGSGGASGGGTILVFYSENLANSGMITAAGGLASTDGGGSISISTQGGNGSVRTFQIKP